MMQCNIASFILGTLSRGARPLFLISCSLVLDGARLCYTRGREKCISAAARRGCGASTHGVPVVHYVSSVRDDSIVVAVLMSRMYVPK
jgi:hypothetical protein